MTKKRSANQSHKASQKNFKITPPTSPTSSSIGIKVNLSVRLGQGLLFLGLLDLIVGLVGTLFFKATWGFIPHVMDYSSHSGGQFDFTRWIVIGLGLFLLLKSQSNALKNPMCNRVLTRDVISTESVQLYGSFSDPNRDAWGVLSKTDKTIHFMVNGVIKARMRTNDIAAVSELITPLRFGLHRFGLGIMRPTLHIRLKNGKTFNFTVLKSAISHWLI